MHIYVVYADYLTAVVCFVWCCYPASMFHKTVSYSKSIDDRRSCTISHSWLPFTCNYTARPNVSLLNET